MQQLVSGAKQIEIALLEVRIPTATVVAYRPDDPFKILVGESSKHQRKVLPGGKIDCADLISCNLEEAAARCAGRELGEEIGVSSSSMRLISITSDSERDVRAIKAGTLKGTLAEALVQGLPDETLVRGIYGNPDFLFASEIRPELIADSQELQRLSWIDARTIQSGELGAGHAELVQLYLQELTSGVERRA